MATKKHKEHKRFLKSILCFLSFFVALSFIAPLLPVAGASANSTMPCCAGKAGHCDSGLVAKKPPQPKEPMCGLQNDPAEDNGITIVAEPSHTESHTSSNGPAAESASLSKPCRMDCGACTIGSTRQQKRERTIAVAGTRYASPLTIVSYHENLPSSFSSNDDWTQTIPRGPPTGR